MRSRSELVFEVEDLLRKTIDVVHARRMLLYRAGQDGLEISPELLRAAEHTDAQYERANELLALRKKNDIFEIQVEWEGLPENIDFTWEPMNRLHQDIPGMVEQFLSTSGQRSLKEKALRILSHNDSAVEQSHEAL